MLSLPKNQFALNQVLPISWYPGWLPWRVGAASRCRESLDPALERPHKLVADPGETFERGAILSFLSSPLKAIPCRLLIRFREFPTGVGALQPLIGFGVIKGCLSLLAFVFPD
jgi:hypothetical protein